MSNPYLKKESHTLSGKNVREYSQQWIYTAGSNSLTLAQARAGFISASGISLSSGYVGDSTALCNSINVARSKEVVDGTEYICDVTFSSASETTDFQSPQLQPDQYQWTFQTKQVLVEKDINDERIENSAGDVPTQAIERTTYLANLQVTKIINEGAFNPSIFWRYAGKCNASSFLGAEAGKVQFIPQSAVFTYDSDNGNYWTVSYSFLFDPDGFDKLSLLDQGFNKLDNGNKVKILDDENEPISDPALLNGNGGELAQGAPPVYLEFDIIEKLDFGVFI